MESFMQLPWWALLVFVATNTFILVIAIILINQAVRTIKSKKANLFVKKKVKSADERGREYGGEHRSSYIDA
ncbi:MAG: hypothetical protein JWP78_246 [Mucilaginibacter sp.]|nr:hypothetical protein [Mucilaginibacter sp.]